MAWTTPHTYTVGELVTAALLNTDVRDNLTFLFGPPRCRLTHDANQSITNDTLTELAFNTEAYDNDGLHDTVTNNTRITIVHPGNYNVWESFAFAANTTGQRVGYIHVIRDGIAEFAARYEGDPDGTHQPSIRCQTIRPFLADDVLEVVAYQKSGGALNALFASAYTPLFGAHWVGGL